MFIPLAENTGLIHPLGDFLLNEAIAQAQRWSKTPAFTIWINISGRQLDQPGLAATILTALESAGVSPVRLGVEVTESALMGGATGAETLRQLARAGVKIAIDDFGTGFSSLARLGALPVDVLKIDRSFVSNLHTERGRAAVEVIIHLAHLRPHNRRRRSREHLST